MWRTPCAWCRRDPFGRRRTGTDLFPRVSRRIGDRDTVDNAALCEGSFGRRRGRLRVPAPPRRPIDRGARRPVRPSGHPSIPASRPMTFDRVTRLARAGLPAPAYPPGPPLDLLPPWSGLRPEGDVAWDGRHALHGSWSIRGSCPVRPPGRLPGRPADHAMQAAPRGRGSPRAAPRRRGWAGARPAHPGTGSERAWRMTCARTWLGGAILPRVTGG